MGELVDTCFKLIKVVDYTSSEGTMCDCTKALNLQI